MKKKNIQHFMQFKIIQIKGKLKNYGFKREFLMRFGTKPMPKKVYLGKAVGGGGGVVISLKGPNYGGSLLLKQF